MSSERHALHEFDRLHSILNVLFQLQRWERKKVKDNSLPVRQTLHVKVGDTVQVIAGSDKKKVGEVVKIFTHNSKIVVKNINFKTKHIKGRAEGESGQIVQVGELLVAVLICPVAFISDWGSFY
jgi:ribosomal protein L24